MKKLIILLTLILYSGVIVGQPYNKPGTVNLNSGYSNINEITGAYGLRVTSEDYAKYFIGFTTTHGYQLNLYGLHINNTLYGGLGTGVLYYNGGALFPVYGDVRFTWRKVKIAPFIFGRSGLLISIDDFDSETRQFINGGAGITFKLDEQFTVTIGPGLFVQMGNNVPRDAFADLKIGLTYKHK